MVDRLPYIAASLCGFLGLTALGVYFSLLFNVPATAAFWQSTANLHGYRGTIYFDAWLLTSGSLLQVVFILALVGFADEANRFWGTLTLLASTAILVISLLVSALTTAAIEAAVNGNPETAWICVDLSNSMRHVFAIAPSPLLALGPVLIAARLLPSAFGYTALLLGVVLELVGFASFFNTTADAVVVAVLAAQELWILAAAIVLALRRVEPAGPMQPGSILR
jgi:hypothetical protein